MLEGMDDFPKYLCGRVGWEKVLVQTREYLVGRRWEISDECRVVMSCVLYGSRFTAREYAVFFENFVGSEETAVCVCLMIDVCGVGSTAVGVISVEIHPTCPSHQYFHTVCTRSH